MFRDLPFGVWLWCSLGRQELRGPPHNGGCCPHCRLCMRHVQGYRQRLSELVLRGMDSEVLSCRVSSTAACVEVRLGVQGGHWGGLGWVAGDPRALLGGSPQGQAPRLSGASESMGQGSISHLCVHSLLHSFIHSSLE